MDIRIFMEHEGPPGKVISEERAGCFEVSIATVNFAEGVTKFRATRDQKRCDKASGVR